MRRSSWRGRLPAGRDDGLALVVEHGGVPVATLVAAVDAERGLLRIVGFAGGLRRAPAGAGDGRCCARRWRRPRRGTCGRWRCGRRRGNHPAGQLAAKAGFELAGLDTRFHTNHDLVKEAVTLFWYAALD